MVAVLTRRFLSWRWRVAHFLLTHEVCGEFCHCLTSSSHLLSEQFLSLTIPYHDFSVVIQLCLNPLLIMTNVRNPSKQEIKAFHHVIPMGVILTPGFLHRVQHKPCLNRRLWGRRGCSHCKPIRIGGNYRCGVAAMCKRSQAIQTDPVVQIKADGTQ